MLCINHYKFDNSISTGWGSIRLSLDWLFCLCKCPLNMWTWILVWVKNIYIYAFSRRFYPKRLTTILSRKRKNNSPLQCKTIQAAIQTLQQHYSNMTIKVRTKAIFYYNQYLEILPAAFVWDKIKNCRSKYAECYKRHESRTGYHEQQLLANMGPMKGANDKLASSTFSNVQRAV